MSDKVKCAWFDFACCEGCQIEMTNFDQDLVALLGHIQPVEFREAMSEMTDGPIDIAFIEGSFTREQDRARLESIRKRATIVIAFGSCATIGGINSLKNHMGIDETKSIVYGINKDMPHLDTQLAQPISAVIPVDYNLHGCPMNRDEFVRVVSALLHGKKPVIPNYPVCVECKKKETVCRYVDGGHCMGVVARAGCGAPCPADGIPCEACRGFVDHPNQTALDQLLLERGNMDPNWALNKSRMFTNYYRPDAVRG